MTSPVGDLVAISQRSSACVQGHEEPELVAALRQHLLEDAEQLPGFALCNVLWSLAVLDQLCLESFQQMCARLEQLPLGAYEPEVCLHLFYLSSFPRSSLLFPSV